MKAVEQGFFKFFYYEESGERGSERERERRVSIGT